MKKQPSYLSSLSFDDKLYRGWPARYLKNIRLPILLILTIIITGIFGYVSIPRRLNPEINIPIVIVNTVLPGANPEDVESLVTVPLERALSSVEGLDEMNSTSRDSVSSVTLQFTSSTDVDKARDDIQTAVDTVNDLPEDATTPKVAALDFENQPIWTFAVTEKKDDTASLMRFADQLKDRIENLSKIDRVETTGLDEQQIEVTMNPLTAKEYGISPVRLAQAVRTAAQSYPAGIVNSDTSSFSLTVNPDIASVEDIRNLRVTINNTSVHLGDVATVSYRSKGGQYGTYLATPGSESRRVVQFFVFKKQNANIDAAFNDTEPVVKRTIAEYGDNYSFISIENTAGEITRQFDDLFEEFRTTILLVFTLLFIFLGLRQAVISSITVPLTFLFSFAVINELGLTLNFLTMFSFLLSLGLLIDDTIVTVAAMTRYYRTGKFTPYQTGIMVWRDFIIPLWSTTITTIWAFVPLLISTGIIGEYIKSIPIVVTVTMLSSTSIAVLITMPLMIVFLKPKFPRRVRILFGVLGVIAFTATVSIIFPGNVLTVPGILIALAALVVGIRIRRQLRSRYDVFIRSNKKARKLAKKTQNVVDNGIINIESLSLKYRFVIDRILASRRARGRTLIAIVAFALIAYLLVPLGFVKNEFFPADDAEIMYVNVDLPSGSNNVTTTAEAISLLNDLRKTPEVHYAVAEVGQGILGSGDRTSSANAILITLNLSEDTSRSITSTEIAQSIREKYRNYTKGKFTVIERSGGPPAGADVQVNLKGKDLKTLDAYADQIIEYLNKQEGVTDADKSIKPGTSKIVFVPDPARMSDAGITADALGLWLRTYATGFTLDSIRFGDKEDDIIFRTSQYDDQTVEGIGNLAVTNNEGDSYPLLSLGSLRLETNPTIITRKDEERTLSVFAAVSEGFNVGEKNADLLTFVSRMKFEDGYGYETGGVNEENQKSVNSILQAMVLSFMLILITMVIEFGSFRQAFISMTIIPISIASVFYIFALTRTPLSFAALIGILALFGIVVTHAIVVIEKINENREHGLPLKDAITDAAANRLEPVLLTSLATIAGLLPITIADPFWRGLGGAIISGLLFSGALKLFFIPVLYFNFFKDSETTSGA